MIAIALTRKGAVLVKMAKCSKDYEPAIETFKKALTEHHNPDTLKKLDDAEKAKRHLEKQEHFNPKLADEGHEKVKGLEDTAMNEALKSVLADAQSMASQSQATPLPLNNPFKDVLSWPKMWAKLTADPTTQAYLQNNNFVRMMHELHKIYLTHKRVIQALGVLLNINFRMPTSEDAEMPESSSLMLLPPERKRGVEAELAKEPDLMLLTAEEEMERKAQVMELDDGDISCLMNRAVAYLAMGQARNLLPTIGREGLKEKDSSNVDRSLESLRRRGV
ncbi:hsp70-Hsp90 organizing protein 1-like [Fagus crenata]